MGPTKVTEGGLPLYNGSFLSSIYILYNQALVGGLSDSFDSAPWTGNVLLDGGSTFSV